MNGDFDTEFHRFISQFLAQHPEVVADQKHEWDHLWNILREDIPRDEVDEETEESGITIV